MAHSILSAADELTHSTVGSISRAHDHDQRLVLVSKTVEALDGPLEGASTTAAPPSQLRALETARVPHITIQGFYHDSSFAEALEGAASDRLMSGARTTIVPGGVAAAIQSYSSGPTPNLIILECQDPSDLFLVQLDTLAGVCDSGTRLMVVGQANDVRFYRELVKRGVSEYVLAPVSPVSIVAAISQIYRDESSRKLGQTCAFIGARGGVGSSTIAHNVAWTIGSDLSSAVILADMDLAFGTAALNLNTEANQGVAEAINDSGRLDHVLLERLLTRCGDHLGLLAAPAVLEKAYDLELQTLEPLLEVAQSTVPYTILDLPHAWSSWSKGVLGAVDDIVIVATPDLASLRNAKNLLTVLKQIRPHDPAPKVVLNQVGVPKRPEIKPSDFADALQIKLTACIAFNAQLFGNAAIKGQMIAQAQKKGDAVIAIAEITRTIAGRRNTRRSSALSGKNSLIRKLLGSRATS